MAAIRGHFGVALTLNYLFCYQLAMYQVSCFYHKMHDSSQNCYISAPLLGPVVNILAIFSNANILKKIKHQRSPLSVDFFILTKKWKNKKEDKNNQTGTQANLLWENFKNLL